jgi:hypothetical protein
MPHPAKAAAMTLTLARRLYVVLKASTENHQAARVFDRAKFMNSCE